MESINYLEADNINPSIPWISKDLTDSPGFHGCSWTQSIPMNVMDIHGHPQIPWILTNCLDIHVYHGCRFIATTPAEVEAREPLVNSYERLGLGERRLPYAWNSKPVQVISVTL